jgi:hypothetical protein
MEMLRKECAFYQIKVDPDKERARSELQEQLAELGDFSPDSVKVVLASLNGKAVRFESIDAGLKLEPIETSDPRVVTALMRHQMGHQMIID